ncbi:hypothetical protein [Thiospirillum jenense]|uniref:Lipoprotein n=1 Tax=Thiospirillum jenense TaxID=1653858 RepID=A0A839HDS9_9GAMM|nr:hypothetical protein [Thiospirillum jenense]MBB1127085.1 hypothetical protein [Thiospirillum jenense]
MRSLIYSTCLVLIASLFTTGCQNQSTKVDYRLLTRAVEPIDYARIQCRVVPMADHHTCLTSVIEHYEAVSEQRLTPRQITGGPFLLVFNDGTQYRGHYVSQPFIARFLVTNGNQSCYGQYNAFAGDKISTFKVNCNTGMTGTADIILDHGGRNGIGEFKMTNGKYGRIVFGHAAVADAF